MHKKAAWSQRFYAFVFWEELFFEVFEEVEAGLVEDVEQAFDEIFNVGS